MKRFLVLLVSAVAIGCAKFPNTAQGQSIRIVFTMTVAGPLRTDYFYRIVMNFTPQPSPPISQGPIAIAQSPWGNGFVAGTATNYIDWQPNLYPPNGYGLFRFVPGANPPLSAASLIGIPILSTPVQAGGTQLSFALDLTQLGLTPSDLAALQTMQVNFLTMNRIPTGSDPGSKAWDALGDERQVSSLNVYLNIPLNVSHTYNNSTETDPQIQEPQGDVADPSLDIIDWSIDVQKP